MKKYLLDTDICIYLIKSKSKSIIDKIKSFDCSQIFISSITLSELEYGVFKSSFPGQNQIALSKFISSLNIISFDDDGALNYGQIRADLEKAGTIIGPMDLLIAAHAVSREMTLVTNNSREFCRIKNLNVENWA